MSLGANLEVVDPSGQCPLHKAVFFDHPSMIQVLLENNGPMDSRDQRGRTALHLAAVHNRFCCARVLLRHAMERGGELGLRAFLNLRDIGGHTALHTAKYHENNSMYKFLVGRGADFSIKSNIGVTAENY